MPRDRKVRKVTRVLMGRRVLKDRRVIKVIPVFKAHKDRLV